jgi:hypothetical protein
MGLSLKVASNDGKLPLHYASQYGSFESLKQDMRQMDKNLYFLKNDTKSKQG